MTLTKKNLFSLGVGVALFLLAAQSQAQSGVSLYHLGTRTIQINQFNPALQADSKFNLALPLISKQSYSVTNAFSFNDVFEETGAGKYRLLNQRLYDKVEDNGYFGVEIDKMTLFQMGFSFPEKNWGFTIFSNLTSTNQLFYSKGLFQILLGGTSQSIGKELVMDNAQFSSMTYLDAGLGFQRTFMGDKLKVGVNLKYLMGAAYVQSNKDLQLSLYTDPDAYEMTFKTKDISFEYALPVGEYGIPLADQDESGSNFDPTRNSGLAVDLGVMYTLLDKLDISFSALDLGAITWEEVSREYVEDKTFSFSGINLDENDEGLADSLLNYFDLQYTKVGRKKVALPSKFLLSSKFRLTPKDAFSLTYMSVRDEREARNLYALGYTREFGKALAVSVNAVKQPMHSVGLGVGTALSFAGMQLYAATDNLLAAINVADSRGVDLRFGFNIIVGASTSKKKVDSEESED